MFLLILEEEEEEKKEEEGWWRNRKRGRKGSQSLWMQMMDVLLRKKPKYGRSG
jgi:hypothetical protein